jgi:hypothetical protein
MNYIIHHTKKHNVILYTDGVQEMLQHNLTQCHAVRTVSDMDILFTDVQQLCGGGTAEVNKV